MVRTAAQPLTQPAPVDPPPRTSSRRTAVLVAIVAAIVILVGGGAFVAWTRSEIHARDTATAEAVAQRDDAQRSVIRLTRRVDRLGAELDAATTGRRGIARDLAAAEARMDRLLGPALADGRSFGDLIAVGADQDPPRLVIDLKQWFTDEAANEAAAEDGALYPGQTNVENGYYIRNADPRWRTLPVDPEAPVSLTTYPFGDIDHPRVITFARFADLFERDAHWLASFPYWITVQAGEVVAIDEQYIP